MPYKIQSSRILWIESVFLLHIYDCFCSQLCIYLMRLLLCLDFKCLSYFIISRCPAFSVLLCFIEKYVCVLSVSVRFIVFYVHIRIMLLLLYVQLACLNLLSINRFSTFFSLHLFSVSLKVTIILNFVLYVKTVVNKNQKVYFILFFPSKFIYCLLFFGGTGDNFWWRSTKCC